MSDEDRTESKAIATSLFKLSVEALAGVLALSGLPGLASGLKLSAATVGYVSDVTRKRTEKRLKRLESHVQYLSERVAKIEQEVSDERTDLFVDVLAKAVMDDEERKAPFYDCVLEWILHGRPVPTAPQVRIAAAAVEQLSYIELFVFIAEASDLGASRLSEDEGVPEYVCWNRLAALGLSTGGHVRASANATNIGRVLANYVDRERLTVPKSFASGTVGKTMKYWQGQR